MLRISRLTDYGIVLLAHLASDGESSTHNARELSERADLPLPAVSKILKTLTHEGLLVSQRGAKGGYGLARDAGDISVAEIISALEGPIALTECVLGPGHCDQEVSCMTRLPWQRVNVAVQEALAHVSLAELVAPQSPGWMGLPASPGAGRAESKG
ncbi:MAG: SUF system Fe-S cluster assembly regulator [Myxococcota bacterium]